MSATIKTPGVYIQELDAFGNSVVPVATAIPAFIGYTGRTSYKGKNLLNRAVRVTSLAEFLSIFGEQPPEVKYSLTSTILPDRVTILQDISDDLVKDIDKAKDDKKKAQYTAAKKTADDSLKAAQEDENVAALLKAQADYDAADDPGDDLKAALAAANKVFADAIDGADFVSNGVAYVITQKSINFRMYSALKFFYENGGSTCYVMTIGKYDYVPDSISDTTAFTDAITLLEKEMEPTMLVIPDLVEVVDRTVDDPNKDEYLKNRFANAYSLQAAMINHCGKMMDRVAILDIPRGYEDSNPGSVTPVQEFRNSVTPADPKANSYAAVYYPWLHTTVYGSTEITSMNLNQPSFGEVRTLLTNGHTDPKTGEVPEEIKAYIDEFTDDKGAVSRDKLLEANKVLQNISPAYKLLMKAVMDQMNLIAPAAGMAGIYTSVDNNDGVWKAPANVGIQSTVKPAIPIDHQQQEDLNMPVSGKSVCAIRAFVGRGNLVWGARTLDGNSNDWRYINVRRTLIFLEQSVKEAAKAFVFAPNDASTWVTVKSMISNFLTGVWKQGGLVGPKPADAFSVAVGLGSTMTNDDILNGFMNITVKVAVSRPAEFIVITWQQKQQEA